jgi:7,8-dihydro-6-hydroxymethylpterin-pyrophosphokinase
MMERRFVLEPLVEIAPDLHVNGVPISERLTKIHGQVVRRI